MKPRFEDLPQACQDAADLFCVNWPRYQSIGGWTNTCGGILKATFLNSSPEVVLKAAAHVIATNTDDYPPSIGKILQSMKDFIGSKNVRTPSLNDCEKCNSGFRLIHFYKRNRKFHNIPYPFQGAAACDCEAGLKKRADGVKPFEEALEAVKRDELTMNETLWFQTAHDEKPPIWTFTNPEQKRIDELLKNRIRGTNHISEYRKSATEEMVEMLSRGSV